MKKLLIEILGWSGAVLILGSYFFLSGGYLGGQSLLYQLMNLVGAIFVLINALSHKALPSVTVNFVWALIAIWALARIWLG